MKRVVLLCVLILGLSGCILAPFIQGVSDLGVTEKDRQRLLTQEVKRLNDALFWGHPEQAMEYVPEENREEVGKTLLSRSRDERIVESKIDSVNFSNSSFDASVSVVVRFFKVPVYVVQERRNDQKWKFSVRSGWKLVSSETGPA